MVIIPQRISEQALLDKAKTALRRLEKAPAPIEQYFLPKHTREKVESYVKTQEVKSDLNPSDYIQDDYLTLPFDNPLELLLTLNPHLTPYRWQTEMSLILAGYLNPYEKVKSLPTASEPLYLAIAAANGSGKDAFLISAFAIWFVLTKIRSRVIVTSSSHEQMRSQTEHYIKALSQSVERKFGKGWFDIVQYHAVCKKSGSEIKLFVTDEPGRAEGYHPFPDYPGAEMAIIKNEAKSISDAVSEALTRCTGFNYWLDVSSPGPTSGFFYRACTSADKNYPEWPTLGQSYFRKVTAYECPHISLAEINRKKKFYGESSPFFRSSVMAEFTSTDAQVVMPYDMLYKVYQHPAEENRFGKPFAGLDFGGGGDESVLSVWQGNTQIGLEGFSFHETEKTVEHLLDLFKKYNLTAESIIADDNGIGQGILGHLSDKGFDRIAKIRAQHSARDKSCYGNLGAELWFKFARFVPSLRFLKDERQLNQLANRYYAQRGLGKIFLEKKAEARAAGHPSPDRADASVLAFCNKPDDFFEDVSIIHKPKDPVIFRQMELIKHRNRRFSAPIENPRFRGSVSSFYRSLIGKGLWTK